MKEVCLPKNISQLKQIIKRNGEISITGLSNTIQMKNTATENKALVDISKIRECNYALKTTHSSIIGVNNSVAKLLTYTSQGIITPLLQLCLVESYYLDAWNISLLQAIFGRNSPPLCKLYLSMINAQVQVIRDTILWIPIQELFSNNTASYLDNFVPIQIRMDAFSNSQYTFTAPSFIQQTTFVPRFSKPIILGQVVISSFQQEISVIQLLYYHNDNIVLFEPYLKRLIGTSFPLPYSQITELFKKLPKKNIEVQNLPYFLQSITSLLHPSFV